MLMAASSVDCEMDLSEDVVDVQADAHMAVSKHNTMIDLYFCIYKS